jgi:hypothetical protein
MRIIILSIVLTLFSLSLLAQSVFINEISYKDTNPTDRGVELAGPANEDVNGWYMEFRDASGAVYHTETIAAPAPTTIDNEAASGRGGIWIPIATLQQNDNRTIILYDDNNVPQDTISYGANPSANYASKKIVGSGGAPVIQNLIINPNYTPQNLSGTNNDDSIWWVLQPSSKDDLNGSSQLPVELIALNARIIKNARINIKWITASETNNSHFEIERSTDGLEFSKIGIITGHGTTMENQTYEFTDILPRKGVNYYRLKQVDYDGTYEYSSVVSIDVSEVASIIIAPNPIRQHSELTIFINDVTDFDFILMDMTGRIVQSYQNLDNNIITINDLSPGIYLYQIQVNNQVLKTDKLVIIR